VETPIRRASASDSEAIADLYLTAREAASPYVPMPAHTDGEVRDWISNLVVPTLDVWLAEGENGVVGLLVIDRDWIDQLYVEPSLPTRGIGRNLLDFAKSERPTGLRLWTFDSNRADVASTNGMDSRRVAAPTEPTKNERRTSCTSGMAATIASSWTRPRVVTGSSPVPS
jgi:hypothetical protein